jgi:hypothetical protein
VILTPHPFHRPKLLHACLYQNWIRHAVHPADQRIQQVWAFPVGISNDRLSDQQ